jgi:hypothetical protein
MQVAKDLEVVGLVARHRQETFSKILLTTMEQPVFRMLFHQTKTAVTTQQ